MIKTDGISDVQLNAMLRKRGFIAYDISSPSLLEAESYQRTTAITKAYSRKQFFKICIISGKSLIEYADRSILIDGTTLFFGNPNVPYSWVTLTEQIGYCCLFTEDFFKAGDRIGGLLETSLFKIGGDPIFTVKDTSEQVITYFLKNMIQEQDSEYIYKKDLFRNYINLIIHEALKMQPAQSYFKPKDSSTRLASLFLDLLERQFPIDSTGQPLELRSPSEFAARLSVHVNYLNRTVKQLTGKTTSEHIAERIMQESKILLKHSKWNISEVGYALGFEYPSNFNTFFKKNSGISPSSFREEKI